MRILFAVLGLGLLLMAGCGGSDETKPSSSAKPPKSDVNMEIDDQNAAELDRDEAIKACVRSEEEQGVPSSVAGDYCDCAINAMIDELGAEGLTRFGMSMLGGDQLDDSEMETIEGIVMDCSSRTLVDIE